MNAVVDMLNTAGRAFVEFSLPMLIQSCVLILILMAVDAFLQRKVRAVFRYWIWMLVLVKLVLPPSLGSPVSVGTWFGETLETPAIVLLEPEPEPAELSPVISAILSPPEPGIAEPIIMSPSTMAASTAPVETNRPQTPVETPAVPLSWQGLTLVTWAVVVLALAALLVQRAFFVRGLLGQSAEANRPMLNELEGCRRHLNLRRRIDLRLSPNAASPAVCGLFRPVILIPRSIASRLQSHDLQAVLLHELAHVKRGDLWVNLIQTLLQIAYFYNPLLWLANAMIRRTREQAVDETVLVAMGETARQYPEILVNIAKLAFTRRPALSLRLIGVVESKSALTARIKHILNRPIPKTARLGLFGLIVVSIAAAVLLPMARADEGSASVDNAGPLDIRLVGVCPDGGDELYDVEGRKLSVPKAFLGDNIGGSWQSEDQRRDFILQAPHLNEPLLFLHTWIRAAGTDRTVGGGSVYSVGVEDPSTLILSSTLDREYRRLGGMIAAPTAPVARVDLPLKYFYGKARDALCTFTGPFVPGKAVQADAGRPFQLTPEAVEYGDGTLLKFRFSTDREFEGSTWVLARDKQGRRYLLDSGQDAREYHGIDRSYQVNAVPWDQISTITVGEKAYEITFRNIAVRYPGRPARTHAAYLDVMAQRLGLTGMSPDQLRQYTVKDPQEALAVLDIVRGEWHIRTTFETLERARPPIRVSELDAATQQKIRQVAARWARSAMVSQYGIQLGLMGRWPEFFDRAMDRLERDYPADRFHYYYEKMWLEGNRQIAYTLSMQWTELNARQIETIKRLILDARADRVASNWLFWCLRKVKSQEVVEALWELAQDERPSIWWNALDAWSSQTGRTRGGYGDLPEKIRVRLSLVKGTPVDEALKARASALVARILTPEVMGLNLDLANQVLRKVMDGFDRETITQIFVESLRQMQSTMTSRQWLVDYPRRSNFTSTAVRMIRMLNVWYGVDIGRLGTNDATASSLDGPQTFAGFQALIAEALEWHRVNRGARPLEIRFEGRVVDTAGRPVPAAELSLTAMERDGEGHRSSDNPQVVHGRTDADGAFVFKSPANTHHMLRVVADGFAARERVSVGRLPDGRFYVSEGMGDNVIVLEKPSSLSGLLLGLDGRPMAGASVHLWSYPTHGVPVLGQRAVDEQGRFTGGAVMSGHHLVRYGEREQTDGAREYEGITAFSLVHVPEGRAVDDVVLDLRQSTAALEIEIIGQDGQPVGVDGLALEIDIPSGRPRYAAVLFLQNVKPRLVHRFANLPPMEGHVSVTVMGRPPKRIPVKLVADGTTRCRVLIDASGGQDVTAAPAATGPQANAAAREVVLPEADKRPVVLDLATGELVPLPPVGPEPQKTQQALRELGKGDILYGVDLGDRTLIFLRDARSEPPAEETGEPAVTGHLIKNLPETITVVTKEGRRYEVTILAADERGCTLKYSRIPTDRGAGGGAPVEPEKTRGVLEFRIAPKAADLSPDVVERYKQTLAQGGRLAGGDFAWFEVRPALNLVSDKVTCRHDGKTYLLLWDEISHRMLADGTWGLKQVRESTDAVGRPAIEVTLDDQGVQRLQSFAQTHVREYMAVLLEDRVIAIPFISASLTLPEGRLPICGQFAEQEIGDLMASLRKGVRGQPPQTTERSDSQTPDDSMLPLDLDVGNPWGEAVEGIRCRLHAGRAVWTSGEVPTLQLDVRNDGTSHKQVFPPACCAIRVDGEWFVTSSGGTGTNLLAGKTLTDLPIRLDRSWRRIDARTAELFLRSNGDAIPLAVPPMTLALAPGTHIVTVAVRVEPRISMPDEFRCLAVVSNPVQVEVVSKGLGDKLELRVVPRPIDISTDVVERCRNALFEGQPPENGGYLWIPIRPETNPPPDAFTETHAGKLWLLVHNTDPLIMVPSQGWKLAYAGRGADQSGRRMVRLEFDSAGAERLQQLTKANNNHPLAMIVNGVIVSAPNITSGGTGVCQAVIVGNFTEQDIEDLIAVLREDINRQSTPPDAGWMDFGEPIPADANDARTLAAGVVLDGIGQDVEGKMFVSSVRDLDATAGREYRFVIHWTDGRVQEPRYRSTGDWFGRRLWEKFTFDAWYNHRQIESIRLQSRPVQEGRGPAVPSPKDEITVAAGTAKPAPSTAAPPGRYAVSFDGQGDYLYVPDSESLRTPKSLKIETWIKPQFGPGPHEQRPGWGVLAKGAYTGTGRVRVQGFAIGMDNFDPNDNAVMFVQYQAIERGVGGADTRMKLPADWVHIAMPFGGYMPAPGQPLVIGLPLTGGDNAFCGQIAEVRIWDGTKAPDIRQYEGKALTGDEPGLVACWTFEEGSGQIAYDISPNANHARLGSSVGTDDADPVWTDLRVAQEAPREIAGGMSGLTNTAASSKDLRAVARAANYKVGPEWFEAAESADYDVYQSVQRHAERYGEPAFHQVLDDWVRWKYKLDAVTDTGSATALFAEFCRQFDRERKFDARDPRARAIGLICDKLNTQALMDRYIDALHTRKRFYSSYDAGVNLSIDDRLFTGHEGDVLPASLSAVWYALRRADEKMDDLDPLGQNVIEDELTPILVREYKRQQRPDLLDRAVLLGGPEVAEFLLKQDWRDVSDEHNRELSMGTPTWYVNKWLLRLIHLDDPAGEKFRRDYPEFVSLFADIWAQSHRLAFEFQIPRFLLLDKDKGTDSFAWRYWPTFTKKAVSMGFWFKRLEREFNYLMMLEPHVTTQMYADRWIQAIDESEGMFWSPRDIIEKSVPVPRRRPLATLLVNAIEERLRKTGTWDEDDRTIDGKLESYRWILKEFLVETAG